MHKRPTPKKLILGLLLARQPTPLSVKDAIRACAIFRLTENNVRVTLVRLSADGLIQSPQRGFYVLGPSAENMANDVGRWRDRMQNVVEWSGAWRMLILDDRKITDRGEKKRCMRALNLVGLREMAPGVFIRPDNLKSSLSAFQQRLRDLGVPSRSIVCRVAELDATTTQKALGLWDVEALNANYRQQAARLNSWLEHWHEMDPDEAARESYLYGGEAIRQVVFDPWLPDAMIDAEARAEFFNATVQYDATGHRIWQKLFDAESPMPLGGGESLG